MTKNISYIFVIAAALLWGSTPAVGKLLFANLDSLQVLFFNSLFAFLGLFIFLLFQRKISVIRTYVAKDYFTLTWMGFLGAFLYTLFFFIALWFLSAQEAFIINYLWPVMAVIFAAVILKEKINLRKAVGLLSSFIGVAIVVTQGNFLALHFNSVAGVLFAIAGAVVLGLFWVLDKKQNYDKIISITFYYFVSSVLALATVLVFSEIPAMTTRQILGLIWLGTFTSGFAFVFWTLALKYGDTAKMSNMIFLTPFVSLVYIHFLVGEKILISSIIGLIIIVSGIVIQSTKNSLSPQPNIGTMK